MRASVGQVRLVHTTWTGYTSNGLDFDVAVVDAGTVVVVLRRQQTMRKAMLTRTVLILRACGRTQLVREDSLLSCTELL